MLKKWNNAKMKKQAVWTNLSIILRHRIGESWGCSGGEDGKRTGRTAFHSSWQPKRGVAVDKLLCFFLTAYEEIQENQGVISWIGKVSTDCCYLTVLGKETKQVCQLKKTNDSLPFTSSSSMVVLALSMDSWKRKTLISTSISIMT